MSETRRRKTRRTRGRRRTRGEEDEEQDEAEEDDADDDEAVLGRGSSVHERTICLTNPLLATPSSSTGRKICTHPPRVRQTDTCQTDDHVADMFTSFGAREDEATEAGAPPDSSLTYSNLV